MSVVEVSRRSLSSAIEEWSELLGHDAVVASRECLESTTTATFGTTAQAWAVLRPADREAVQGLVRIANRFGIPLYPFSSGKNWGYGSRAPVRDGVLVDLSRLNRIIDFDEDLAFVTIEPGVTQRQLQEFLAEQHSRLWMDATGASPDCSIIGNTMERGFGHTPMGDHCANACALGVVLPTGEYIETGFARFGAQKAGALGRWGNGPSLDGLFSQSNFGIVTQMSVWLMPAPEHFEAFFFLTQDERGLGPIVDALRPLRLNGTLRSAMHIGNDYKVLAATSQYPWTEMSGRTPLDRETARRLRRQATVGAWNGSGGLYGTKRQVREAKRLIRRALAGRVDRLQFVDERLIAIMQRFAKPFRLVSGWDVTRTLSVLTPVYGLLRGVPTEAPLASTYWRKRIQPPSTMDPDRDRCGLLWCSPVVPNSGTHMTEVTDLAIDLLLRHGFEPQISVSLATERSAFCVTTLSYDRDVAGEDARAMAAYRELTETLISRGYPPYRLNVAAMEYGADSSGYGDVISAIKRAVDPNSVLAPGRYVTGGEVQAETPDARVVAV